MANKLVSGFRKLDLSGYPDFYDYATPLEKGMWVLWVAKNELGYKQLTAKQIAIVIRECLERKCESESIFHALKSDDDKVGSTEGTGGKVYFRILYDGTQYLESKWKRQTGDREGGTIYRFESGTPYSSKETLATDIFPKLKGEIKIVDKYCGIQTLTVLKTLGGNKVKFLTKRNTIQASDRSDFFNKLANFNVEYPNIEFGDYMNNDLHDRYIITPKELILIGHSMKNLGDKESFVIILKRKHYPDFVEALEKQFDNKWQNTITLAL